MGRPRKNNASTEFGDLVAAALAANAKSMAGGPRSQSDLARVIGVDPAILSKRLMGLRPMTDEFRAAIIATLGVSP